MRAQHLVREKTSVRVPHNGHAGNSAGAAGDSVAAAAGGGAAAAAADMAAAGTAAGTDADEGALRPRKNASTAPPFAKSAGEQPSRSLACSSAPHSKSTLHVATADCWLLPGAVLAMAQALCSGVRRLEMLVSTAFTAAPAFGAARRLRTDPTLLRGGGASPRTAHDPP
eukprot:CAMPEP_0205909766 /NCGR_PEP_ID=MMETSP1325-20131115/4078_1 /ASSEMBLY_ACC=CAM_ASM_000708 /TAXON_ID=236786 /ORGANISM="Florenciella sp., Strain RCC1007" /LENGTH=168 /DNA_ID=CAMNT_0053276087 /DNA_START=243 /DNA_END=746 /DNA_ORIENTATION=-